MESNSSFPLHLFVTYIFILHEVGPFKLWNRKTAFKFSQELGDIWDCVNYTIAVLCLLGHFKKHYILRSTVVFCSYIYGSRCISQLQTDICVTTICTFLGAGGEDTGLKNAPGTGWDLQGRIYSIFSFSLSNVHFLVLQL